MDYNNAFLELDCFRRPIIGDSAWINDYIQSCVQLAHSEVTVPEDTYELTEPIFIPYKLCVVNFRGTYKVTEALYTSGRYAIELTD